MPNTASVHASASLEEMQKRITWLSEENAQLKSVLELRNCALDAATIGFMIIDMRQHGRPIAYLNRALADRTGYRVDELLGKPSAILTPSRPNREGVIKVRDAMRVGAPLKIELQSARRDGSLYWTGMSLFPIRDAAGEVTHYVSVSADISARMEADRKRQELQAQLTTEMDERKRVEGELVMAQKLEAVGRLAAGVAHEINTPIQYVGDSVQFLQSALNDYRSVLIAYRRGLQDILDGASASSVKETLTAAEKKSDIEFYSVEVPKALERTMTGVERVAQIVRAMKEFSHPDVVDHQPADLNQAIATTILVATNEYKYCAQLETDFSELPPVLCNVGELNQVFLNLIVNAAHAIEATGKDSEQGRIRIATRSTSDAVELEFTDNGCGIPAENLNKIYDPFFTTKEVGKGTGQGLAITRSIIVDKHHGSLQVKSVVGEGTTFTLRLPIAVSQSDDSQQNR